MANVNDNKLDNVTGTMMDASQRQYKFKKTLSVGGYNKTGTFIATIPTIAQRIQIGVRRAKMLDGAPSVSVDGFTDDLAFMVAYLEAVLVRSPKWFIIEEMDDVNTIREMFYEVSNWVNSFQRKDDTSANATDSPAANDEEDMEGDEDI